MLLARTIDEVRIAVRAARGEGRTVGFVPTMGFLHDGHISLFEVARANGADFTVASIFVNPTQFGPNEDFEHYPRDEERDTQMLEAAGVDLLFAPALEEIYGPEFQTKVLAGEVAGPLEGERRPGHFDGVATVVLKLFNIVMPDLAVFGEKDAQQCAVLRRMVLDLDVPVRLVFAPTLREEDQLAQSSRNSYLSVEERRLAPTLHRALSAGLEALAGGATPEDAEAAMLNRLSQTEGVGLDYLRVVDPATFRAPTETAGALLLVGAVRIGRTRLIDNLKFDRSEVRSE